MGFLLLNEESYQCAILIIKKPHNITSIKCLMQTHITDKDCLILLLLIEQISIFKRSKFRVLDKGLNLIY